MKQSCIRSFNRGFSGKWERNANLVLALVAMVLVVLIYPAVSHLEGSSTWPTFWDQMETQLTRCQVLAAIAPDLCHLISCAPLRWKIFLRPVRKKRFNPGSGFPDLHRLHWTGLVGASRRIDSPLPDRAPNQFDVFFADGGLGCGTHLRYWRLHRVDGSRHIPSHGPAISAQSWRSIPGSAWVAFC